MSTETGHAQKPIFLSVFDRDGMCPLNLARTKFDESDEEMSDYLDDFMFKSTINLLVEILRITQDRKHIVSIMKKCGFVPRVSSFVFGKKGFCLAEHVVINHAKVTKLVAPGFDAHNIDGIVALPQDFGIVFLDLAVLPKTTFISQIREIYYMVLHDDLESASFFIKKSLVDSVSNSTNVPKWLLSAINSREIINIDSVDYTYLCVGDRNRFDRDHAVDLLIGSGCSFLHTYSCKEWSLRRALPGSDVARGRGFADFWAENIGGIWEWPEGYNVREFVECLKFKP